MRPVEPLAPRNRPDPDLACVECLEDGVTVDCHGRCRECRQSDTETYSEWSARVALRRERA